MRKLAIVSLTCVLALVAVSCGKGGKYADVTPALNEQASLLDSSVAQLEKASSGKEVAEALTALAGKQEKLIATMKALSEKYPEMKTSAEPPAELKEVMVKLEQSAAKFGQAMMTAMQKYGTDPQVQEAMKKFQAISAKMQQE